MTSERIPEMIVVVKCEKCRRSNRHLPDASFPDGRQASARRQSARSRPEGPCVCTYLLRDKHKSIHDRRKAPVFSGNKRARRARITLGSCSPAEPSSVYERSKPLGPSIFISQLSLACEPRMEIRQSPGISAIVCSMAATISARSAAFDVLCSSTITPTANSLNQRHLCHQR